MTIRTNLGKKYPQKTEFGRGFMTCILKFVEHAEAYLKIKGESERAGLHTHPGNLWFYGASDHLLEAELPEELKGTEIEDRFVKLESYLGMRLGFGLTEEHVIEIMDLCREIALLLDKRLGLEPDLGEW